MTDASLNLFDYFFSDENHSLIHNNLAIEFHNQRYTYKDLKKAILNRAEDLSAKGIQPGDRIALLLHDSPDFIAYFFASLVLGAICVPVNTFIQKSEIDYILSDSGAKLLISDHALLLRLGIKETSGCKLIGLENNQFAQGHSEAQQSVQEISFSFKSQTLLSSPAFILYTSGSTGKPKGALHRHANIIKTIETYAKSVLKLNATDRVFSASRLFFAYGLGNSLSFPLAAGSSVILENERPSPQAINQIFHKQKPTVFFGVPAVYRALLDLRASGETVDTSSLRLCVSAGEALPAQIFEEWYREFGLEILDGIGSTEMLHIFISNRVGDARAGSTGKVVEGYEVKLLDDTGSEIVGVGTGNLLVNGESAMLGYWQRDDLTADAIINGWMKTGDVYQRDEQGYFYHLGRSDDCFKVKGLWVSPVEVETALLAHPNVVEAAVVASTDEQGLATAKAFIIIRTEQEYDLLNKEIVEFAKARLAIYKVPTQYEFIQEMPRTSTGKIQRFKLRKI
jgi:benzoate-CoA ligase family protein